MFWNNFVNLCNKIGKSPNGVCAELGYSTAIATKWKNGSTPRDTTLKKIADYFDIPVSALTTDMSEPLSPTKTLSPDGFTAFYLTPHETKVMNSYRTHPEMQPAVDKLLGITDDGNIILSQAAKSGENRKPGFTQKPLEKWESIENAPETDDELL